MTGSAATFLLVTGIVLPLLAWASKRKLDAGFVFPRIPFYIEAVILQLLLTSLALFTAVMNRVNIQLPAVSNAHIALSAAILGATLVTMMISWTHSDAEGRRRLLMIIPVTRVEKFLWVFVSAGAAISEEIVYRGVMFTLIARMSTVAAGVVITSLVFALAHLLQGWRSATLVFIFGVTFQLLAIATGGLTVPIVLHLVYDVATGFILSRDAAAQEAV